MITTSPTYAMPDLHPDISLDGYNFELPEARIAQHPAERREDSQLMVLRREQEGLECGRFADILTHLPPDCLLVANNSRVIPARLTGRRASGGKVELFLLTPLPLMRHICGEWGELFPGWAMAEAEALLRPAKKIKPGEIISFTDNLSVEMVERGEYGRAVVRVAWRGDLQELLTQYGQIPLPPYIRRPSTEDGGLPASEGAWGRDSERYQTAYAKADKAGSVAAPTAGLHFTPELQQQLIASGREWAELTLYVGYGTFSPVRSPDIREHDMHSEYVEIPEQTAAAVLRAKREGRPIIAVGTTSARSLEGAFAAQFGQASPQSFPGFAPFKGWTNIFLYPGKALHVVDGLITNFHLPGSSLLMLVAAMTGRERILNAYQEAISREFRFFSYGDAMLIL